MNASQVRELMKESKMQIMKDLTKEIDNLIEKSAQEGRHFTLIPIWTESKFHLLRDVNYATMVQKHFIAKGFDVDVLTDQDRVSSICVDWGEDS